MDGKAEASRLALMELDYQLLRWRETLPEQLRWSDEEAPPRGINAARLRAKYYGARYVIHRPFLLGLLHPKQPPGRVPPPSPSNPPTSQSASSTVLAKGSQPSIPMPPPTNPILNPSGGRHHPHALKEENRQACDNCIDAAFRSTGAFHGIPENHRPIVTNIFGTAHA